MPRATDERSPVPSDARTFTGTIDACGAMPAAPVELPVASAMMLVMNVP